MLRLVPNPRGMALVMAMIVVVLITMLVAGAISFTGTERAASEVQTQEDEMSACVQAARNLFLTKLNARFPPTKPDPADPEHLRVLDITFNEDLKLAIDPDDPSKLRGVRLKSAHLGQVAGFSSKQKVALTDESLQAVRIDNSPKPVSAPTFYTVTAVCREDSDDLTSPEREIEFMVRVGL